MDLYDRTLSVDDIYKYQLENLRVEIRLVTDLGVDLDYVKKYFIHNIKIDHKAILAESFIFKHLDHIEKTIAGKEKWIN